LPRSLEKKFTYQNRVAFLQRQLRHSRLDLFLNLRLQAGVDRERHLEDVVDRRLVVNDFVRVLAGTESVDIEPVDGFHQLVQAALQFGAVRSVLRRAKQNVDRRIELPSGIFAAPFEISATPSLEGRIGTLQAIVDFGTPCHRKLQRENFGSSRANVPGGRSAA
jgi:hypothetical protein